MEFSPSRVPNEICSSYLLRHPALVSFGAPFELGRHLLNGLRGTRSCHQESLMVLQVGSQEVWRFGQSEQLLYNCTFGSHRADLAIVCRGLREGSSEQPLPEEDSGKDHDWVAPLSDDGKLLPEEDSGKDHDWVAPLSDDGKLLPSHQIETDWRAVRARLVADERADERDPMSHESLGRGIAGALGKAWAHPLCVPETGCVLIANDMLDGQFDFERTVILLLRVGSNKPREGPFGVILNRSVAKPINDLGPDNRMLADIFGNCHYYHGGPLESELFLLLQEGGPSHWQFGEIIPGISYIGLDVLQHAVRLLKDRAATLNDFRYFVGYAGWSFDQLMQEIESGYWHVAACSTSLLRMTPSDRLWKKVLRVMGGRYAELSRKPRKGDY